MTVFFAWIAPSPQQPCQDWPCPAWYTCSVVTGSIPPRPPRPHQVAIADLLGMVVGIQLARLAGSTALYIWGAWMILSAADFICILKSLDTIVFKFLNLERASLIAHGFVNGGKVPTPGELAPVEPILSRPRRAVPQGNLLTGWYWDVIRGYWAGTFRKISETTVTPIELKMLLRVFANGQYMVLHSRHPKMSEAPPRPCLVLRQSATEDDVLEVHCAPP